MAITTIITLPYINRLTDLHNREQWQDWITSMGIRGYLVVFGLQVLQVIIAFIPGEPVEIVSGIIYGGWVNAILLFAIRTRVGYSGDTLSGED